nr:MAG TPA: hypothetical protein [Crassvirales sp.]
MYILSNFHAVYYTVESIYNRLSELIYSANLHSYLIGLAPYVILSTYCCSVNKQAITNIGSLVALQRFELN